MPLRGGAIELHSTATTGAEARILSLLDAVLHAFVRGLPTPAPKGAFMGAITVCLKAYPDTNLPLLLGYNPATMNLTSGSKLGPYEIVAPLGAGGMGEVFRARDSRLKREVAIKVLTQATSLDPERLRRFEQEALATAALNHPNILAVFDIGTNEGSPYVVSELLEGETLRERLRSGSIAVRKTLDYALQIAHGLAAAHEKGIIHRDLKPENLFLTKDGRAKILDFGLAKLTQAESGDHTSLPTMTHVTEVGTVLGTAGYMSPEQVRGVAVDARSDIFSFGAIQIGRASCRERV